MADSANTKNPSKYNLAAIMRDAHRSAKHMMQSPGWAQYGYGYVLSYALGCAWRRAKVAAMTETQRQIASIESEIANLEYLPLAQNVAARRAALQSKLSALAA